MRLNKLLLLLPMVAVCACSSPDGDVEYYPIQLEDSNSWSFIGPDGAVYYEDDFENMPTCVVNGFFTAQEGNGYTVYQFGDKKPRVVKDLEDLKSVGVVSDGIIPIVRPKERITFVDTEGVTQFVLEPVNGREILACMPQFSDGLLVVLDEKGKIGYLDKHGEVAIKLVYDDASVFDGGYALAAKQKEEGNVYYILNTAGDEVHRIKSKYNIPDVSAGFKDGVTVAYEDLGEDGSRAYLIDTKGEYTKLDKKVSKVIDYNSDIIIYANADGNCGIISRKGDDLVRPKYDMLTIIDDNTYLAKKDGKYSLINKDGDKIDSDIDEYSSVSVLSGRGFCMVGKEGSNYVLLNSKGERVGKTEFKDITDMVVPDGRPVFSDYFNVANFVDAVTNLITSEGVDRYRIGSPVSMYLTDPKEYAYKNTFKPDQQPEDGYRYSLDYTVASDEYIAKGDWSFYSDETYYYFNNDAQVACIVIGAYPEISVWGEAKPLMRERLEDQGFKLVSDNGGEFVMANSRIKLKAEVDSDDDVFITITPNFD